MKIAKFVVLSLLVGTLLLSLTACGNGVSAPAASGGTVVEDTTALQETQEVPLSQKLLLGTLLLEDTGLAVTSEQAVELLPLWKAVKAVTNSDTAAAEEMEALYTQIQDSMTDAQVKAIEEMEMGADIMQTVMDKLGIDMARPGGGGEGADLTDEERAQMLERMQAQGNAGGVPGAGGGPGGGGGFAGGGGAPPAGGDPGAGFAGAPGVLSGAEEGSAQGQGAGRAGFNTFLLDPLIELLAARATGE